MEDLDSWEKMFLNNLVIILNWILISYYLYNWHYDSFLKKKGYTSQTNGLVHCYTNMCY